VDIYQSEKFATIGKITLKHILCACPRFRWMFPAQTSLEESLVILQKSFYALH